MTKSNTSNKPQDPDKSTDNADLSSTELWELLPPAHKHLLMLLLHPDQEGTGMTRPKDERGLIPSNSRELVPYTIAEDDLELTILAIDRYRHVTSVGEFEKARP